MPRVYIINPHSTSVPASLVGNTLYGAARNEKLLKQTAVKLGQRIAGGKRCDVRRLVYRSLGGLSAVSPDDGLHELTDKIVC